MKIAIEAQRIFRPDKHGMDFVALETIRELQKRNDGNEYYIIVAPGKDHCLEESANLSIVEVACSTALGTDSPAAGGETFRGRPAALHVQHSPALLSDSAGADAPRHHLSGTPPTAQSLALSGNGPALPPPHRTTDSEEMPENHYRFALRTQPHPRSPEHSRRPHYDHLQRL